MTQETAGSSVGKWGIAAGFHDIAGNWRRLTPQTEAALRSAMGAGEALTPPEGAALVHRAGRRALVPGPGRIETEEGDRIDYSDRLPERLRPGYHRLETAAGISRPLIVSPGRCPLPRRRRAFGFAAQLYAVRSETSWGFGDLGDLAVIGRWAARLQAGLLVLNPLHAAAPGHPQERSPYYPSSRRFRNPLYIRVEDVPGAAGDQPVLDLARSGRRLLGERRIDHDRVYDLKLKALRRLFRRMPERAAAEFARWPAARSAALREYATFCALTERHGRPWQQWPAELRNPRGPAVARFARSNPAAVRFHVWLQWLLDGQLARAGAEIGLVNDLAVGVHPDGADAWAFQDVIAPGVSVGAPPDPFNDRGQDWGLPPFDPWKLRAAGYAPFIETVRAAFTHSAGLRVDHVMGLFRLFWIPAGAGPAEGGYVHYPASDLLDILALESSRAGAYVVGEDLGTVEDGVRRELAARRVLSTRVAWFEDRPPRDYPRQALAALATHDLPTVAGIWEPEDADPTIRERLRRLTGLGLGAPVDEVVLAAYAALAEAPSRLLSATLDDVLSVPEQPNLPGTLDEYPNWSLALPSRLESLMRDPRARRLAQVLRRR